MLILITQEALPAFSSRTNLKLQNISVTPKLIKKVMANLDLPKASCPDGIAVVVLQNCESKLSSYYLNSLNIEYVSEGVLFSRLLERLIGGP